MIIGIGGVSRSGKSSLAVFIKKLYPDLKTKILCQDDFVIPEDKIPKINGEIDWECPESIDWKRFLNVLKETAKKNDILIAEGLLVFYDWKITRHFNRKIFIEIPENLFRKRKVTDTRWGSFPDWYVDHIWNSFLEFGNIKKDRHDFLFVNGELKFNKKEIIAFLEDTL
jgi:uridine kinase